MIKTVIAFSKERPSIATLAALIAAILIVGSGLSISVFIATAKKEGLLDLPICFTYECTQAFFEKFSPCFSILKATIDLSVAIATIGGIFVALLSYFNTASNAALTNHIEHLKVFTEYLESEIKKREKLTAQQIDSLLLYNTIFNQSRFGKTTVSDDYKTFINELNEIIIESNSRCVVGTPGGFSYKDHQRKVKEHLKEAGIVVYMAPRNDYFEMEEQLFSLLHRISQSFCPPGALAVISNRTYY